MIDLNLFYRLKKAKKQEQVLEQLHNYRVGSKTISNEQNSALHSAQWERNFCLCFIIEFVFSHSCVTIHYQLSQ